MAENNTNNPKTSSYDVRAFAGTAPTPIAAGSTNESYTSADGSIIYLNFLDDSTGLFPSSGLQNRFSITKSLAGSLTTVSPSSTFIDPLYPKTVQLRLSTSDKLIDGLYSTAGIITSYQTLSVNYTASTSGGYGTIPLLSDDDSVKTNVSTFSGLGISNRTVEANGPVFLYAYTSTDGSKVYSVFREATPPLLPSTGIGGFAVSQSGNSISISNAYVLDPSSVTNGKIVVLDLASPIAINDGSNSVTVSYSNPSLSSTRLKDSTAIGSTAPSFSGSAVTNLTAELIAPRIVDAYTNVSGTKYIFVKMSEPTFPGTAVTGFSFYVNGTKKVLGVSAVGNSTYLGTGVSEYIFIGGGFSRGDTLELEYTKGSSNYITDQSANLNTLQSLANRYTVRNLWFSGGFIPVNTAFNVYLTDDSYVDVDGKTIYLYLSMPFGTIVTPTNLEGLYIFVDGQSTPIKNAVAQSDPSLGHIKVTLYNKIYPNSTVEIYYVPGNIIGAGEAASGSFSESSSKYEITNNSSIDRVGFFDVLDWYDNTKNEISYEFDINENTSELFKKYQFANVANTLYDITPPKGIVILNKSGSQNEAGIKLHKFEAYGTQVDETGTVVDFDMTTTSASWKIDNIDQKTITKLNVKLKVTNSILNTQDYIRFDLYSNSSDGAPESVLANISVIQFSRITSSYQEFELAAIDTINLEAETSYWIVATCDNIVPVDINNTPVVYISTHTSTDKYFAYSSSETSSGWLIQSNKSVFYKLFSTDSAEESLLSSNYLLDIFEKPTREISLYGSESSLSKYETFGDNQSNYVWKRLVQINEDITNHDNDVYPTVSKIEIVASSAKPKNYVVEVRTSPTSNWYQLFDTLTDETTLDSIIYNFDSPIKLSDIRLVYKGDYFTIDSYGDLTVVANDFISDVEKIQISHFSDFRDSSDFNNSDENGFLEFSEGLTEFLNWDITNNAGHLKETTGYSSSEVLTSVVNNSKIILGSNNKVFTYYNGETTISTNDEIVSANNQITCSAVYKNKVYIGTSSGLIYSSSSGEHWIAVNSPDPLTLGSYKSIKPIRSMCAFGDLLLIGTEKGNTNYPSVYSFDGKSIEKIKDFDSTYESVSSIGSAYFHAYVGLGSSYNGANSVVYSFNNVEWNLSLTTELDDVQAIAYSTAKNSIIAAFRGGNIYELPFVNSLPTSWSNIYDISCDNIFAISDDPNGNYLFISGDLKSAVYIKDQDTFKVIDSYKASTPGLNINWRKYPTYAKSYSSSISDLEDYTSEYYGSISELNYSNFTQSGFGSSSRSIIEGYFKAKSDGDYKFKIVSNMGTNFYISGTSVTSNYSTTNIASDTTIETSQTFTLTQDELLDFKIESFVSNSTTPSMKLYWNNVSGIDGYEIVPEDYFFRKSKIKNILTIGTSYFGVGADGKVYSLSLDTYTSKRRNVYARYKDLAGNIHGLILPGRSNAEPILSDKIFQDLNTFQNTYQTKGKIYQIQKKSDNTFETKVVFAPNSRQYSIYAPERKIRETGYYEAQPFFVPTLVKWSKITNLIINKYSINTANGTNVIGLDAGTSVKVYIRTGATRSACLNATWSDPYEISYINNNSSIPPVETQEINIENYNGKWLQYKFELISATKNLSPEIVSTTITYVAGTASYYFTKIFDTADYDSSAPVIRRGILTSNELLNNGTITYGYINSDDPADIYDFNKYNEITPNKIFEIESPTSQIKFGILFTSVGTTPSVVYNFAVQLDLGDSNIKFMPSL